MSGRDLRELGLEPWPATSSHVLTDEPELEADHATELELAEFVPPLTWAARRER